MNGDHSSKKEFAPRGANSFLEEVTSLRKEAIKGIVCKNILASALNSVLFLTPPSAQNATPPERLIGLIAWVSLFV